MCVGAGDAARRNGAAIGPVRPLVRDARDIGRPTIPRGMGMRDRTPLQIDSLTRHADGYRTARPPLVRPHATSASAPVSSPRCPGSDAPRNTAQRVREPASPSGGTRESSRTHPFDAARIQHRGSPAGPRLRGECTQKSPGAQGSRGQRNNHHLKQRSSAAAYATAASAGRQVRRYASNSRLTSGCWSASSTVALRYPILLPQSKRVP